MPGRSFYSRLSRLSAIIFILPSSMAAGAAFGYFIVDRFLGSFPWGTVVLALGGAGVGFRQILEILEREPSDKPRA